MLDPLIDSSDADATHEIAGAADRTAVDLAPLVPDATAEVEALDILQVETLDVTPTPAPGRAPAHRPSRSLSVSSMALRAAQPSSLAPLSVDVVDLDAMAPRVARDSSALRSADDLRDLSWLPAMPTSSALIDVPVLEAAPRPPSRALAYVGIVAALCLAAGTVGAVLGYERSGAVTASAPSTPTVFHAPRTPTVLEATEQVTDGPGSAPDKRAEPGTTGAAAAASATARTTSGATGMLRVPSGTAGALVDGVPHRVDGPSVTIACGRHRVKVPGRAVRVVDVPCGGSAAF